MVLPLYTIMLVAEANSCTVSAIAAANSDYHGYALLIRLLTAKGILIPANPVKTKCIHQFSKL